MNSIPNLPCSSNSILSFIDMTLKTKVDKGVQRHNIASITFV